MKHLAELDLPFLAVDEPAFAADPTRFLAEARQQHRWLATSRFGYYVHDYEAIAELLLRPDQLRTSLRWRPSSVPREKIPELRAALETLGLGFSMDASLLPRLEAAIKLLERFAFELMAERRQQLQRDGQEDLLDVMLAASLKGNLADRELADLLVFLLVAGYITFPRMCSPT